ncbi:hypothetical protein H2198_003178 [Neophaeococcomyces mojaviensis]|uniref:Uncharacterized protein n=1 Tax=Neophaeococcomyces mojaviensis TaxID=3383035 RepID=A0ACC3ACK7_9EURO|nr:hypothetical protein H2198_003178 [Knufia sp. JES_112]
MKKGFKSQASSARAASTFGGLGTFQTTTSPLSYIAEQPDLSQITEPQVVVALKNLGKKDSTTKAKALDELLGSLKDNSDLAVLTAWSDLYPRTSIDNSQIVRRSAHTLQGILTANAGKKIAPILPKLVPSWLAGLYDNDKSVAKAASDALDRSFATPEKRATLWKVYKDSIFERVEDSLVVQTPKTLSDERTTSPDEAENKYVRVVGTAMRLLEQLLSNGLGSTEILQEKRLWQFAYHDDAYLRNGLYSLLHVVLNKYSHDLDWTILSECFLFQGLKKSQVGSARGYASALIALTKARPSIWTADYTAKTSVAKRLFQFLRHGSQSGPQDTWTLLSELVKVVPVEAWKQDSDSANTLIEAYRAGVLNERVHIDAAWTSYIQVCQLLSRQLDTEGCASFAEQNLLPIVTSYVNKSSDEKWRIGSKSVRTVVSALIALSNMSDNVLHQAWASAVDSTIEKMRLSLPESSKDFRASQEAVAAQGNRLLALQRVVVTSAVDDKQRLHLQSMLRPLNASLLHSALDLLKSRNGKPYGAASIIETMVRENDIEDDQLEAFLRSDLQDLLNSPSCEQLVALAILSNKPIGSHLLSATSQSPNITRGTVFFLSHASREQLEDGSTRTAILNQIDHFKAESERKLALAVLANGNLPRDVLKDEVLARLINNLSDPEEQEHSLEMLEAIASQRKITEDLSKSEAGASIASKLLLLADSSPALADRASVLNGKFNAAGTGALGSLSIIKQQLRGEGDSLSILTVTDLGLKSVAEGRVDDLLPEPQDWQKALQPHLEASTNSNLAITSPLQGVVWAVEHPKTPSSQKVVRDTEDFSLLFRITFYVTKVFANNDVLTHTTGPQIEAMHQFYPIALQLINEKITLDEANDIWLGSTEEVLHAAADVLSEGSQLLQAWQSNDDYMKFWMSQGHTTTGFSREAYLTTLAFLGTINSLVDRDPRAVLQEYEAEIQSSHKSPYLFQCAALLCAIREPLTASQGSLKLVNELIAGTTQSPSNFNQITLLNILLKGNSEVLEKVPQQRLVFLFRKLTTQLEEGPAPHVLYESLGLIATTTRYVQEVYGEHWEQLVTSLIEIWATLTPADVAGLHSSLQVYTQLKGSLRSEEVSDDLQEAWSTNKSGLDAGIIHCLQNLSTMSEDIDQPRSITAEYLRRQLGDVKVPDTIDLYKLLASGQPAVRRAAYDLLHQAIPEQQEQLSYDLVLENKIAQLPEELLQLVNDKDDMDRCLLSWLVVFDHYPKAAYKLREAYTDNIKVSGHLENLLEYICEKTRLTSSRPLDASKINPTNFDIDSSENSDQQLTVHLYYLCLLYLPSLVKNWHLQQKNRIKIPLETWTQKYMSPFIIAASLDTVTEWSSTQTMDDDRKLELRASARAGELVASIPVDPESPPISLAIMLPATYPLESPAVISRSRVGVSEKNWTSWLRTFQIIIFSTGSIIEGLIAFKRNVQLALKGHSECAICYSIIGQDMQTPNKKCGTCKNTFHGACLFRWFRSSNSSSCPLCRNNFNYA